ncbi:hypothetical protein BDV06DRAFT_208527 [Aspergillus oleicola]
MDTQRPNLEDPMQDSTFASKYRTATQISDLCAESLIELSEITQSAFHPLIIFDNACGTGVVSSTLLRTLDKEATSNWELTCGDLSQSMLSYVEKRMADEGWVNAEARILDSQDTGLPSGCFTHVFSGFAFNLFPDPQAALSECLRILQPGGTLAISLWKQCGWFDIARSAITAHLSPSLPYPGEEILNLPNSGWDTEYGVRTYLETAGFSDIETTVVEKKCTMTLDDLADACLMMVPFVLDKFWTSEQRDMYADKVPGAVREYIEAVFGVDGMGELEAEAVIAVARSPR